MNTFPVSTKLVPAVTGVVAVHLQGDSSHPAVVMTHSILSSSAMWDEQADLLVRSGWYVVRIDTIGHGASRVPSVYAVDMDSLVADSVAVMDALYVDKFHYVGLSLGGMSGFGMAINHGHRLLSAVLCDARADAPLAVAAPWDDRIALAQQAGSCMSLALSTVERWFGSAFVKERPDVALRFQTIAANTSVQGFVACARAIQGLNYLADMGRITNPMTFVVGMNDGVLPEAMKDLQHRVGHSVLENIPDSGHLPNVDQPAAFNAALMRHFDRFRP